MKKENLSIRHRSIRLALCIFTFGVILSSCARKCECENTKPTFEMPKLKMEIRSAYRTGRGGQMLHFTAAFMNEGEELLVIDPAALSLSINYTTDGRMKSECTCTGEHLIPKYDSLKRHRVSYDEPKYFIVPEKSVETVEFETAYIGDWTISERVYYGWEDDEHTFWMEDSPTNVSLCLTYAVPVQSYFDTVNENMSSFDGGLIDSPRFQVYIGSPESAYPPLHLELVDAHMVSSTEPGIGRDQIAYTVRIESATNEVLSIDSRYMMVCVSWNNVDSNNDTYSFGLSFVPPLQETDESDMSTILEIPPKGVVLLSQTTKYIGKISHFDLFPEKRPVDTNVFTGFDNFPWEKRIAEKYKVSVQYDIPYQRRCPTLYTMDDFNNKTYCAIVSEERETTLGQTRFVGEAWLQEVGEKEEK